MALGDKQAVTMAVASAVTGNIPVFGESGQLRDSGTKPADFAAGSLTKNLTLYVDAATGDDGNDGLAPERSKKTIMAAVNAIPKNLGGHNVVIEIADGDYTGETLSISGFYGGANFSTRDAEIVLQGESREGTLVGQITSLLQGVQLCIKAMSITTSNYPGIFAVGNCRVVDVSVTVTKDGWASGIANQGGTMIVQDVVVHAPSVALTTTGILFANNVSGTSEMAVGAGAASPYQQPGLAIVNNITVEATGSKYGKSYGAIIFENGELVP